MKTLTASQIATILVKLAHNVEKRWENEPERFLAFDELQRAIDDLLPKVSADAETEISLGNLQKHLNKSLRLRQFLSLTVPLERLAQMELREDEYAIRRSDGTSHHRSEPLPLTLVLEDIRSSFNVGAMFRTSECCGVENILLGGYTASPEHPKTLKTTKGTHEHLNWKTEEDTQAALLELKAQGLPIVMLETSTEAPSIYDFSFPKPCALVVGNEQFGISPELLKLADHIVQIPVFGQKNSLNVATALGICVYEIRRQWQGD